MTKSESQKVSSSSISIASASAEAEVRKSESKKTKIACKTFSREILKILSETREESDIVFKRAAGGGGKVSAHLLHA